MATDRRSGRIDAILCAAFSQRLVLETDFGQQMVVRCIGTVAEAPRGAPPNGSNATNGLATAFIVV